MAVAEPRLTDYIIGTMKLTRREGDYDAFLALRGVPYPVRLVLQTELGTFSDTAKAPVPLDGAARRPAVSARELCDGSRRAQARRGSAT